MMPHEAVSAAPVAASRHTMPTLPCILDEYARLSCLPDADDDLVFEPTPALGTITGRVPFRTAKPAGGCRCTRDEALLLALVDGVSPVAILIQLVDMDPGVALVIVCDLYARGLVDFY